MITKLLFNDSLQILVELLVVVIWWICNCIGVWQIYSSSSLVHLQKQGFGRLVVVLLWQIVVLLLLWLICSSSVFFQICSSSGLVDLQKQWFGRFVVVLLQLICSRSVLVDFQQQWFSRFAEEVVWQICNSGGLIDFCSSSGLEDLLQMWFGRVVIEVIWWICGSRGLVCQICSGSGLVDFQWQWFGRYLESTQKMLVCSFMIVYIHGLNLNFKSTRYAHASFQHIVYGTFIPDYKRSKSCSLAHAVQFKQSDSV